MSDQNNLDPEVVPWLRSLYQLAHSDLRWMKEQGWRVVNWALLLYGAVLGIAKFFFPQTAPITFILVDGGILLLAIYYLVDLYLSEVSTRKTTERIEAQIPEGARLWEARSHDPNHVLYLYIRLSVVVVSFVLVVVAHLWLACSNVAA